MGLGYFSYAWLTIRHKYWVLVYGLKIGCPIYRLIMHDVCKFYPSQYPYYQQQFFGNKGNQYKFNLAWLKHQNSQDHHWEYWWQRTGHDKATPRPVNNTPLPMTDDAILEMLSDWMGASRAYSGEPTEVNNWKWLDEHWAGFLTHVHPETAIKMWCLLTMKLGKRNLECP